MPPTDRLVAGGPAREPAAPGSPRRSRRSPRRNLLRGLPHGAAVGPGRARRWACRSFPTTGCAVGKATEEDAAAISTWSTSPRSSEQSSALVLHPGRGQQAFLNIDAHPGRAWGGASSGKCSSACCWATGIVPQSGSALAAIAEFTRDGEFGMAELIAQRCRRMSGAILSHPHRPARGRAAAPRRSARASRPAPAPARA